MAKLQFIRQVIATKILKILFIHNQNIQKSQNNKLSVAIAEILIIIL